MPRTPPNANLSEEQLTALSAEQLSKRLAETQSLVGELEKHIRKKQRDERKKFIQELKEQIASKGYDLEEIAGELMPGTFRARVPKARVSRRKKFRYVDPHNPENTYISGPFALWMKKQMIEKGMDTGVKEERESFKKTLKKVPIA